MSHTSIQPPTKRSTDKTFYDTEQEYSDRDLAGFIAKQELYIDRYAHLLKNNFSGRPIRVLELGAGTCTLSTSLSRHLQFSQGVMYDISSRRMEMLAPRVSKMLGIPRPNFTFVEGDFADPSSIPDGPFDLILFDASLHHARSMWSLLSSCRDRLAEGGLLVAQREQYVAPLTRKWKMNSLVETPEVRHGVSENAYLVEQYTYYLKVSGFDVSSIAAPETNIQKILFFLNGLVFSKWILVARPAKQNIGQIIPLGELIKNN